MPVVSLTDKSDNAAVVSVLEKWLELARAGEVSSLAVAGILTGRRVRMSRYINEAGFEQMALVGCLVDLQREVAAAGTVEVK